MHSDYNTVTHTEPKGKPGEKKKHSASLSSQPETQQKMTLRTCTCSTEAVTESHRFIAGKNLSNC